MSHLPTCEFRISRPVPPWEIGWWACDPACPVRRRTFDPAANARAAVARFLAERPREPWATWPVNSGYRSRAEHRRLERER